MDLHISSASLRLDSSDVSRSYHFEEPKEIKEEFTEDIFRCESQMISTYVRQEHRDPETHKVDKVHHAFSFCNHADLPDDVLEKVIKERWKDLFGLTGSQVISMADKWPEEVITIDHDDIPDVEKWFPPRGPDNACNHCDHAGLQRLTGYHLMRQLESEKRSGLIKAEDANRHGSASCTQGLKVDFNWEDCYEL